MIVRGHGFNDDRQWINFASSECKVTVHCERREVKPVLQLWFRAFMSYRNSVVETPLGRLVIWGAAENVGSDEISGYALLEAPSGNPGDDWRAEADEFLKHIPRGLAFAHGGRLQTPLRDYAHGPTLERTFFAGSGFAPELPVQHHLNQGPFIKALAERFERSGPLPEILWTALGWMQTDTEFDETRFLSGMTALEAVTNGELNGRGTIISKKDFAQLREKFKELIVADDTLPKEVRKTLLDKVSQLNTRAFSQKIHALFDDYAISKRDFQGSVVRDLVRLRDAIVHTGLVPENNDIWPNIILVRELITRIILKEIGFVGRYCCYVGGVNDRDFPGEIESSQET
jgi:hypothetical protein